MKIFALLIACFIALPVHSKEKKTIHSDTLGYTSVYSNPNSYLLGSVASGDLIADDEKSQYYTNVRFQPYGTIALYDETVLFCGNVSFMFNGKSSPVVVIYQTAAHRLYQGIGCHILLNVFELKPQDIQ